MQFTFILATKKGFIICGERGLVCFFDLELKSELEAKNLMNFKVRINMAEDLHVAQMHISESEKYLSLVCRRAGQVYYCAINTLSLDSPSSPLWLLFPINFRSQPITALLPCRYRQLVASYSGSVQLQMMGPAISYSLTMPNQPLSVSLHPLGLFIAVAYYDNIQIYAVLYKDVVCIRELNHEGSGVVKYSNRGHYLLGVVGSQLFMWTTSDYALKARFGDVSVTRISSLYISEDDSTWITRVDSGEFVLWDYLELMRQNEEFERAGPNEIEDKRSYLKFVDYQFQAVNCLVFSKT